MISDPSMRIKKNTSEEWNKEIRHQTEETLTLYECGDPVLIKERLNELDREWDIEQALEANAAALGLLGLTLSAFKGKRWMLLSIGVGVFLFQHAVQGWCPPLNLLRRMGFRTRREIDEERYGLKVLRGDFKNLPLKPETERPNMRLFFSALRR